MHPCPDTGCSLVNLIWAGLPEQDKITFLQSRESSVFNMARNRVPPHIKQRMDALGDNLSIYQGEVKTVEIKDGSFHITCQTKDGEKTLVADYFINTSGPTQNIENSFNPLIQSLMKSGRIVPSFQNMGINTAPLSFAARVNGVAFPSIIVAGAFAAGANILDTGNVPSMRPHIARAMEAAMRENTCALNI